jgi:hypothetical protein
MRCKSLTTQYKKKKCRCVFEGTNCVNIKTCLRSRIRFQFTCILPSERSGTTYDNHLVPIRKLVQALRVPAQVQSWDRLVSLLDQHRKETWTPEQLTVLFGLADNAANSAREVMSCKNVSRKSVEIS